MKMRKSRVSMAIAAVLSAACVVPATSFGLTIDVAPTPAVVKASGAGDALLFPFYTTANGATTSFSVTNTANATVAVKLRFREQRHSIDALDLIAVLSPFDKFDFQVSKPENSIRPVMAWNDNTCVIGPPLGAKQNMFPAPRFITNVTGDAGENLDSANADLMVGHVEVLGMADISAAFVNGDRVPVDSNVGTQSLASAARHNSSSLVPANCELVSRFFSDATNVRRANVASNGDGVGDFATFIPFRDAPNSLMGRYVITFDGKGIEAGSDAIVVQNSDLTNVVNLNGTLIPGDDVTTNRVGFLSSQTSIPCQGSGGSGNCGQMYSWDREDWFHPHLGEMVKLANLQLALSSGVPNSSSLSGDWSNNPANFVGVDWVVSFLTKYTYIDFWPALDGRLYWGMRANVPSAFVFNGVDVPGYGINQAWVGGDTLGSSGCVPSIGGALYNAEEQKAWNADVSPGAGNPAFCKEVNVFTMYAANGSGTPRDSLIQSNDRRVSIVFKDADFKGNRGWAKFPLNWGTGARAGDATVGLNFTTRATNNPNENNASLTELQKGL